MLQLDRAIPGQTTYKARLFQLDGVTPATALLTLAEASPGFYSVAPTGADPGDYIAVFYFGSAELGRISYRWDGTKEISPLGLSDAIAQSAKQSDVLPLTTGYDFVPTAQDIYVALGGSASNDGKSLATAWTAEKLYSAIAALQVPPGTRILFKGGETFDLPDRLNLSPDGSAAGSYEISSYGPQRATLTFPVNKTGILFYNRPGKVFHINITARSIGGTGFGLEFYSDPANSTYSVNVQDCDITGFDSSISVGSWGADTTSWIGKIQRVRCYKHAKEGIISFTQGPNNKSYQLQVTSCYVEPASGNGIVLSGCNNSVIENCVADGYRSSTTSSLADNLIWFWRADDCTIKDCTAYNARGNIGNTDGGSFGIDIESNRCIIERCFAVNSYGIGVLVIGGSGHVIRNNVIISTSLADMVGEDAAIRLFGVCADIEVLNNTVYLDVNASVASRGLVIEQGGTTGVVANNIFHAVTNRDLVRVQNANTKLYQNTYYCEAAPTAPRLVKGGALFTTLASFREEGLEMRSGTPLGLVVNPLFKLPSGKTISDYELQPSSIANGLNLLADGISTKTGRDYFEAPYVSTGTPVAGAIQRRSPQPDIHLQGLPGSLALHWARSPVASTDQELGYFREMAPGLFRAVMPSADAEQILLVFEGVRRISLSEYSPSSGSSGDLAPVLAAATTSAENSTILVSRLTTARVAKLDTVATESNADLFKSNITGLESAIALTAKTTELMPLAKTAEVGSVLTSVQGIPAPNNQAIVEAKAAAESADAKLTAARLTRIDNVTVQADLSAIAKTQELAVLAQGISAIPTIVPDNQGIADAKAAAEAVSTRLTPARATALDWLDEMRSRIGSLFGLITTDRTKFTAIALSEAPSSSGGLTVAQDEKLSRIDSNAELARMGFTNRATVNTVTAIATIWRDDGLTPAFKLRMLNTANQPNVEEVVSREVVP